jgi:hypothetical protein
VQHGRSSIGLSLSELLLVVLILLVLSSLLVPALSESAAHARPGRLLQVLGVGTRGSYDKRLTVHAPRCCTRVCCRIGEQESRRLWECVDELSCWLWA